MQLSQTLDIATGQTIGQYGVSAMCFAMGYCCLSQGTNGTLKAEVDMLLEGYDQQ